MEIKTAGYQTFAKLFFTVTAIVVVVHGLAGNGIPKTAFSDPLFTIIAGLVIYSAEVLIAMRFLGNQKNLLWLPFSLGKVRAGLLAFLLIFAMTSLLVHQFDRGKVFSADLGLIPYLAGFLFNLIPSAIMEEWLFRFFPKTIMKGKSILHSVLFYIGTTALFTLSHLPKYYQEGNIQGLSNVFVAGIIFLIIYHLTQNLPFVILVHAFTNGAWFIYQSSTNWLFLYFSISLVTLIWGMVNIRQKMKLRSSPAIVKAENR